MDDTDDTFMSTPLPQLILSNINKLFKLPVHPFNLSAGGGLSYAEWQYEKGEATIAFYLDYASAAAIFEGKSVLDVGCGAAGKSLYYAALGAKRVVGIDVVERYREEAVGLAERKGLSDKFEFALADASATGFKDGEFDAVILNDAVEHVADPGATLRECLRVLAPGGKVYLNFPPYYHPYGAHLSDAIAVPWVHAFFSEKTMIAVYKRLVAGMPDAAERISLRISEKPGGGEYLSYINRMTIRRFKKILRDLPARCVYYREAPLRGFLRLPAALPGFKEFFVKMTVAILEPLE